MPEWVNTVGTFLVNLIPELIVGVVLGVVILIIEYWTGWFAEHTSVKKNGDSSTKSIAVGSSIKPVIESIVSFIIVSLVLLALASYFYTLVDEQHQTVLDNPEDPNVVVGTIKEGDTLSFFGNDLFITVDRTVGSTILNFTVGSPGYPDHTKENAEVGYSIIYQGRNNYHVRVTSHSERIFSGESFDFTVAKLEDGEIFITPTSTIESEEN